VLRKGILSRSNTQTLVNVPARENVLVPLTISPVVLCVTAVLKNTVSPGPENLVLLEEIMGSDFVVKLYKSQSLSQIRG